MSGFVPALGALFAPAAGGALGGGLGLFGSIVAGIGSGLARKAEIKAEEKREIDRERRREARYSGVGEAMNFGDAATDTTVASASTSAKITPQKPENAPLGFRDNTPTSSAQAFRYDPATGKIVNV